MVVGWEDKMSNCVGSQLVKKLLLSAHDNNPGGIFVMKIRFALILSVILALSAFISGCKSDDSGTTASETVQTHVIKVADYYGEDHPQKSAA
jgi:hypothetical protein